MAGAASTAPPHDEQGGVPEVTWRIAVWIHRGQDGRLGFLPALRWEVGRRHAGQRVPRRAKALEVEAERRALDPCRDTSTAVLAGRVEPKYSARTRLTASRSVMFR